LKSGICPSEEGVLLLEPQSQSILLWLFFGDGSFMNYLSRLAWNLKPPDLSLPSSWDYRCEPLAPGFFNLLYLFFWVEFLKIIVVLGVHCDIYQSGYHFNIVEFIPSIILLYLSSHSYNSFNRSHSSIFIHEYIIFPPYSPPTPFAYIPLPLVPIPRQDLFYPSVVCF
jgi:hypothetical protein